VKIVIPGGTGQVGTLLARAFHRGGHEVVALGRSPAQAPWRIERWDPERLGDWTRWIDGADAVINMAGRSVNCRYNAKNRREIMHSRVGSTRIVGQAIARATRPPATLRRLDAASVIRTRR
jgi:NAD dependent epimerase/dehydratase family enzyme